MTMISPNVTRTVGEVLESHNITPHPGERMADTVARALGLSDPEAQQWLEALSEGCTPEEANTRVGIASHRANEPLMVALARAIGPRIGKIAKQSTPPPANPQDQPLKDQGDKLKT